MMVYDPLLFSEAKRGPRAKSLGTSDLTYSNKHFSWKFSLKDTTYEFLMSPFHATFPDSLAIIDLIIQTVLDTTF